MTQNSVSEDSKNYVHDYWGVCSPGFSFGKLVDLFLEVDYDLLVLLLEQMGGLF